MFIPTDKATLFLNHRSLAFYPMTAQDTENSW